MSQPFHLSDYFKDLVIRNISTGNNLSLESEFKIVTGIRMSHTNLHFEVCQTSLSCSSILACDTLFQRNHRKVKILSNNLERILKR